MTNDQFRKWEEEGEGEGGEMNKNLLINVRIESYCKLKAIVHYCCERRSACDATV